MPEPNPQKKVRGVFERPAGSEIWWIQYFENGRRHRERVGAKSHAIKLYQKRKTQIFTGAKLPELQRRRVTFAELLECGVAYAQDTTKPPANMSRNPICCFPPSAPGQWRT